MIVCFYGFAYSTDKSIAIFLGFGKVEGRYKLFLSYSVDSKRIAFFCYKSRVSSTRLVGS